MSEQAIVREDTVAMLLAAARIIVVLLVGLMLIGGYIKRWVARAMSAALNGVGRWR